jgi:nitroreductase
MSDSSAPEPVLHPLLKNRWSPRVWDPSHVITESQIAALLEAARWAPSAGNSQPWSFIVAQRGDDTHRRILPHLARSSGAWAPDASLLMVNVCHRFVEGTEWDYSEFAEYDLGQAVAHMTFQAQAMGLAARQFRAFDLEALTKEFEVAAHWEIMTITAIGVVPAPVDPATSPADGWSRDRRDPGHLRWRSEP